MRSADDISEEGAIPSRVGHSRAFALAESANQIWRQVRAPETDRRFAFVKLSFGPAVSALGHEVQPYVCQARESTTVRAVRTCRTVDLVVSLQNSFMLKWTHYQETCILYFLFFGASSGSTCALSC